MQDFCSVKLPPQGMTYPYGCLPHHIAMWTLPGYVYCMMTLTMNLETQTMLDFSVLIYVLDTVIDSYWIWLLFFLIIYFNIYLSSVKFVHIPMPLVTCFMGSMLFLFSWPCLQVKDSEREPIDKGSLGRYAIMGTLIYPNVLYIWYSSFSCL
jgi:hypothetical protein